MRLIASSIAALLISLAALAPAAQAAPLTAEQQQKQDAIVNTVEQTCLHNPAAANQKNEAIRMMMTWASDPKVCSCQKEVFRKALTPESLNLPPQEQKDYFTKIAMTDAAACGVPVIKQKFSESCEAFFGTAMNAQAITPEIQQRMASFGVSSIDEYVDKVCGCMRPAMQKISTREWIDSSMAQYNAYLERKRTGNNAITAPPGAFDGMINGCTAQLQAEAKAAKQAQATTPSQPDAAPAK